MLKQIEEKKARLEADLLKIQMQTCLEEAKNKEEEEEKGQPVQSCCIPSPDQPKEVEQEVKNCRKLCVCELFYFYFKKIKSTNS